MGTWLGHAAPGTFFILFSFWWTVRSMHRYYSRKERRYENSLISSCCCSRNGCLGRLPLEAWLCALLTVIGAIMEIVTSYVNTKTLLMGNQQHFTMYISFALVGIMCILAHHKVKFIPKGAEYMTLLVALMVELVLFRYHLHGRDEADIHIHMLLVYTIGGCIAAVSLEMLYPHSVNALVARCYFFLLQGTWFYQIAFTLYPPEGIDKWNLKEPESIMRVTLAFSWHLIGCFIAILILSGLAYWNCLSICQKEDSENVPESAGGESQTSALLKEYNRVISDEEDELYTSVMHKVPL